MFSQNERAPQSFEVPEKKKRRAPVFLCLVILACLAVFVAYEWRDISYSLPAPLRGTPSEVEFYDAASQTNVSRYAYESLDANDKEKYRIVYKALTDYSKHPFPTDNLNEIRRIEDCVLADFPELYDRAALVNMEGGLFASAYVAGVPLADEEELDSMQAQIEGAVAQCLSRINSYDDDYTKAKKVYEWLAETTSYGKEYDTLDDRIVINATGSDTFTLDEGSSVPREHGQTVYNALIQKRAVCAGYAKAFQYLMQRMGIECTYISGTATSGASQGGLHAWCLIKLDGDYYFIDPTWGDPEYESNWDLMQTNQNIDYRYFAVTTDDITKTHEADATFFIPVCTATADNYYVREGLVFDTVDAARFGQLVSEALRNGESVSIRCTTEEVYEDFLHNWVETGEIGRYAPTGSYQYVGDNSGLYTITIWPPYA